MTTETNTSADTPINRKLALAILVAALGYFVDVYDIVIFNIVRVASLKDLGLSGDDLTTKGVFLLNVQMIGMLLGGFLWGIWGDKRGRLEVLFGSILLYSISTFLNAFVSTVPQYAVCRFIGGIGLAGEVGAGITLVSELLPRHLRGYGSAIVAGIGVFGAVVASLVGDMSWKTAYLLGGGMGVLLLALRISVADSGLFRAMCADTPHLARGDLRLLFFSRKRLTRFVACWLVGVPVWAVVALMYALSPEIGRALELTEPLSVGQAILYGYSALAASSLVMGLVSQALQSRRKVILGCFAVLIFTVALLFSAGHGRSAQFYYAICAVLGVGIGYWSVYLAVAAEQFGTNLRATVATALPNLVRGAAVLVTSAFLLLKAHFGVLGAVEIILGCAFVLAVLAMRFVRETFGIDLAFVET